MIRDMAEGGIDVLKFKRHVFFGIIANLICPVSLCVVREAQSFNTQSCLVKNDIFDYSLKKKHYLLNSIS